jgi:hypothetical protein
MTYIPVSSLTHLRMLVVMDHQTLILAEGTKSAGEGNLHLLGGKRYRVAKKKLEDPLKALQREGHEEGGIVIPTYCTHDMGYKFLGSPIEHVSSQGEKKIIQGVLVWIPFCVVATRVPQEITSLHLFDYPETWRYGMERMHDSHRALAAELFRRATFQYSVVPNRLTRLFKAVL